MVLFSFVSFSFVFLIDVR
uniref:Uncharacterized protein n=1 Tax=Arundo donax TaxID=35708 RepID=A0A0A8YQV3_ARUDO